MFKLTFCRNLPKVRPSHMVTLSCLPVNKITFKFKKSFNNNNNNSKKKKKKSPGDVRKLAVTQTLVKAHQRTLM